MKFGPRTNARPNSATGVLGVVLLALAGCAPVSQLPSVDKDAAEREAERQRALVVEQQVDYVRKLNRVAFPVMVNGEALCRSVKRIAALSGFRATNKYSFKKDLRKAAEEIHGIDGKIRVLAVAPGSPAEAAGVRLGDEIVELNGWKVPEGKDALGNLGDKYDELTKGGGTLSLVLGNGQTTRTVEITPVAGCDYTYSINPGSDINAFADGDSIFVESGMMEFVRTDEELATVVGHEVAHNLMGHISKQQGNAAIGFVFDLLAAGLGVNTQGAFSNAAARAFSQEFEAEADYVGLYLTARAGFKIDSAPQFWRRMGVRHPGNIKTNHAASHPATPYRFIALEKTVGEIRRKQKDGLPLVPEKAKTPAISGDEAPALNEGG